MKKFNISSIGATTAKAVNTTEDLMNKVKSDVPAAKDSGKDAAKKTWGAIKDGYKNTRKGEAVPFEMPAPKALTEGK